MNTHGKVTDHRTLAETLAPAVREACDGRLSDIHWFKADWQHGGAATGIAEFSADGVDHKVVLKMPVNRREMRWMLRLQDDEDADLVIPRLFACGDSVGGYDLTWIVMEFFPVGPLGMKWSESHIERIAAAAAGFHLRTTKYEVDQPPRVEDWPALIDESIECLKDNILGEQQRWRDALKAVRGRLGPIVDEWRARDTKQWLHGDLHLANAMSRTDIADGPVALIDLAEVHAGNWVEDAVYLERQLWARPKRLKAHKPVPAMAAARRKLGLPVEEDYARLAIIRRFLLAATAPKFIRTEGHPRHLEACLKWINVGLSELG